MLPPSYQYLSHEDMPTWRSEDELITNKLIAGNYKTLEGNIDSDSELIIIWSDAKEKGISNIEIDPRYNTMIYLIKGSISVAGFGLVEEKSLVVFNNDGNQLNITSQSEAQYLILAGVPIDEKVVQQGPFVMNSETDILIAMRDYQMGKMGILIEE